MKKNYKYLIIVLLSSLLFHQELLSQNLDQYYRDFLKVQNYYYTGNTKKLNKSSIKFKDNLASYGDNLYVLWIDLHTNETNNLESMLAFNKRLYGFSKPGESLAQNTQLNTQLSTELVGIINAKIEEGLITEFNKTKPSDFVKNIDGIRDLIDDEYISNYSWRLSSTLDAYLRDLILNVDQLCSLGRIDESFIHSNIERIIKTDVNDARHLCDCELRNEKLDQLCGYFKTLTASNTSFERVLKIAEYLNGLNYEMTILEQNSVFESIKKAPLLYQREYVESNFPLLNLKKRMKENHDSLIIVSLSSFKLNELIKYYQEVYLPETSLKIKSVILDGFDNMNIDPFNYKFAKVSMEAIGKKLDIKLPTSRIDSIQHLVETKSNSIKWFYEPQHPSDYSFFRYKVEGCEIVVAKNDIAIKSDYFGLVKFMDLFEFVSEEKCSDCPSKSIEPVLIIHDSILYFDIKTHYYESGSVSNFYKVNLRNGKLYDFKSNLLLLGVHSGQNGFQSFALDSRGYLINSTSEDTLFINSNTFLNSDFIYVVDYNSKSRPVLTGRGGQGHFIVMKNEDLKLELNGDPFFFDSEYFDLYTSVHSTYLWPSYLSYGRNYYALDEYYEVEKMRYLEVENRLLFSSLCNENPSQGLFHYHSKWIDADEQKCDYTNDLRKSLDRVEIITEKDLLHYPDIFLSKYKNYLVPYKSMNELYQLSEENKYTRSSYSTNNSINSYRLAEYFELMSNCDYRSRIKETYRNSINEHDGSVLGLLNLDWEGQLMVLPSIQVDRTAKLLFDHYSGMGEYKEVEPLASLECSVNLTFTEYNAREKSATIKVEVALKNLDDYYLANSVEKLSVNENLVNISLTKNGFTFLYKVDVELNQVDEFKKRVTEVKNQKERIVLKVYKDEAIFSWNPII